MGDQNLGEAVKQALNKKVTGDFDKMVENRIIRALVPYSKTFYFLDGATPKGAEYEMLKLFEKQLNKKLKTKHLKVHVIIIPTPRDRLIPTASTGSVHPSVPSAIPTKWATDCSACSGKSRAMIRPFVVSIRAYQPGSRPTGGRK